MSDVDSDYVPRCLELTGCEIEELATDITLNQFIETFIKAKALYNLTEDPKVQQPIFEQLGLYHETDLHLALEAIYSQWLTQTRKHSTS
jgi:hypothetical protein